MRCALFGLAWVFVFLAAAYDAQFAWRYREVMESWELNPVVCWAVGEFGLSAVLGFKFAALIFAVCLAVYCRGHRRRLEPPLTLTVTSAYALLSLHYLLSFWQLHSL